MIQLIQITRDDLMKDFETLIRKVLANTNAKPTELPKAEFYSRPEVAELLGVSFTTLYHWNKSGILKNTKIGRRVYYARSEVLAKLDIAS